MPNLEESALQKDNGGTPIPALASPQGSIDRSERSSKSRHSQSKSRSSTRHHGRSSRRPSGGSGSRGSPFKECVCGRGIVCLGMTQAFRMLGDPRCYHVELPRYRKNPPGFKYIFRNNLRQAYLRQMLRQNPTNEKLKSELESADDTDLPKKRRYVALHHFHPRVVRAFYENPLTSAQKHKVPISITKTELGQLGMECREEDQILSASGFPTGGYYFTPNYPHEKAHQDLKRLIQAVRGAKAKQRKSTSSEKNERVPADIAVTTSKSDNDDKRKPSRSISEEKVDDIDDQRKPSRSISEEKDDIHDTIDEDPTKDYSKDVSKDDALRSKDSFGEIERDGRSGLLGDDADEFEKIWDKPYSREIESNLVYETVIEEEEYIPKEEYTPKEEVEVEATSETNEPISPRKDTLSSRRSKDRPWATPKYRRNRETAPTLASGAADYIDPNNTGDLSNKLASKSEIIDDGEDIARIAADMTIVDVKPNTVESTMAPSSPKRNTPRYEWSTPVKTPPAKTQYSPKGRRSTGDDEISLGSADSDIQTFIKLDHQLPGADPTLRIQVHNDLIAWESKRRSDLAQQLEYDEERWNAARDILMGGLAEAKYAERLILGTCKASRRFADSLNAVYDDKLLDDKGNAVKNSFLRNRLAKQRNSVEYSIENEDSKDGSGPGSPLLDSIVSAQLEIANAFVRNSEHLEQEIIPEIIEFKEVIQADATRLQSIGDAVIAELKQSEVEVKNIWDVFDAMVTGDLMEYTVHGSSHGGSSHGGSFHGGSLHSTSMTGGSGSIQGFLTIREGNEAPIVSSSAAPLVKSSFHQLGLVEDGWLIEMYYKSAISYQRSVFGAADMELRNLFQEISTLEEMRFKKLHQLMLAFAPRQRRLFNQLPGQLKNVLENMVGLRIDEESLQKVLDEAVKDRSKDHLKGSTAHKSSIMNRSRIKTPVKTVDNEVEDMEKSFGSPFASPMILLSKIVELKATGLASLVNTAWKSSLAVVTSEGNLLVFETTGDATTPPEAFKSLYPQMNFDDQNTWVNGRKAGITKSLTPTVFIQLSKSNITVSQLRQSQVEITQEANVVAGSRFMKAMKSGVRQTKSTLSGAQQTKCTLRLPSPKDASDWVNLLERTQKVLQSKSKSSPRLGRF